MNNNNRLDEVIRRVMREQLLEMNATNNLPYRTFCSDMKKLGFIVRDAKGTSELYYIPDCNATVTVHIPHGGRNTMKSDSLKHVARQLNKIGWFKNPDNYKKFPWKKWELNTKEILMDTTEEDIVTMNELYKNADVIPVFEMKNSVCVLDVNGKGVNLCWDSDDRRPLLDKWYDKFGYDNKTNKVPCLKIDDEENFVTYAYPIKKDGTLDMQNVIEENRIHRKPIL